MPNLSPNTSQLKKAVFATPLLFFIFGLSNACWAPMVPYIKEHLNLNNADLGLILLQFGTFLGPALIGFAAELTSLSFALGSIAVLLVLVGISVHSVLARPMINSLEEK